MPVLERLQVARCARLSTLQGLPPVPQLQGLAQLVPDGDILVGLPDHPGLIGRYGSDLVGLAR
ncbi:MAG: hypothetical protein IPG61_19240 [bacterium]|nr:hypothetical protein [bacterium]